MRSHCIGAPGTAAAPLLKLNLTSWRLEKGIDQMQTSLGQAGSGWNWETVVLLVMVLVIHSGHGTGLSAQEFVFK